MSSSFEKSVKGATKIKVSQSVHQPVRKRRERGKEKSEKGKRKGKKEHVMCDMHRQIQTDIDVDLRFLYRPLPRKRNISNIFSSRHMQERLASARSSAPSSSDYEIPHGPSSSRVLSPYTS